MEAALKSKTVGAVDLRSVIYHFQEATSDKLVWPDCPFKLDDIRQGIKIYLLFWFDLKWILFMGFVHQNLLSPGEWEIWFESVFLNQLIY